jgi:glycine cleavage system H protein
MAQYEGINLPDELYYHPDDHLWVRMEGTRARVGIDDMAQHSAGTVSAVRIKPPGRSIARGKPFGTMEAGKYVGPLRAPLSGLMIEINPEVMNKPGLLNDDPYGEGWLIIIEPEDAERDLSDLMHGSSIQAWLEESVADWRTRGLLKD